jgi:hypothetical protein
VYARRDGIVHICKCRIVTARVAIHRSVGAFIHASIRGARGHDRGRKTHREIVCWFVGDGAHSARAVGRLAIRMDRVRVSKSPYEFQIVEGNTHWPPGRLRE